MAKPTKEQTGSMATLLVWCMVIIAVCVGGYSRNPWVGGLVFGGELLVLIILWVIACAIGGDDEDS